MGNAPSTDETTRATTTTTTTLQEQLAELERAAQRLRSDTGAHAQQLHPVLPHQLHVDGAVISTRVGVRVLVGPVVGRVDFTSSRILLEVDADALVTCHVSVLSTFREDMHELPQCQLTVRCAAGRPATFHIKRLLPGRDYKFSFGGIDMLDVKARSGGFRTPTLETSSAVHAIAVSGNSLYDLARCEAHLWRDVQQLVATKKALLVVHLGGQVVMERMFDQSCALLMRHASIVAAKAPNWPEIEAQAMQILRSAYRTQWNAMPEFQFVLAHASNLMIWSDMDVYPAFTTRREFFIDHEKPTIQMQVIRTVTRCARRLYHEYQRQLWDDEMDELFQREKELFSVAEKALASTAQIYQLGLQIPLVQSDLELQKKRHEIEGARRVEKNLRALEAEKVKAEKQLVSFNQLLAPQRGEEFVHCVGEIGFLFLDLRSTRLEPGGAQAAENDLMSNVQWEFVEKSLESSEVQVWIVCSELPVVDEIPETLLATISSNSNDSQSGVNSPDRQSWWGRNPESQARLLGMLFDWKMEQSDREFVLLSGASSLRFTAKSSVKDTKMRTKAEQCIVGAITASHASDSECSFTPRKLWTIHERFEVEHSDVAEEKAFVILDVDASDSTASSASSSSNIFAADKKKRIQIAHVTTRQHARGMARVLLGPVVGFVDDASAVILLEVDRAFDVICTITNPLTGEMRSMHQHFEARTPNSFYWTHLRPEHYYQVSFGNIQHAVSFQASFSTLAQFPSRFELLALCNDDLLCASALGSAMSDGADNGGQHSNATTLLWDSVADKVVNVPFARVNLTIHLGGQFRAKTNVFIEEALVLADAVLATRKPSERGGGWRALVIEKLRQMYRLSWNLPGVRDALAHGAHIMVCGRHDALELVSSSETDLLVQELLEQVHEEYQNSLLPPSKRTDSRMRSSQLSLSRASKPLSHAFGTFGIFFLPIGDFGGVTVHSGTWDALRSFLSSPRLSVLMIVTEEAIIEDSLEDAAEKARFSAAYKSRFGFYQRELLKLLELLFEWKRSGSSVDGDQDAQVAREVVFISGNRHRSFDSVIQEVVAAPTPSPRSDPILHPRQPDASRVILQYVVGPMTRVRASELEDMELPVFSHGTLANKYAYHHFFAKKALDKHQDEGERSEAVADSAEPSLPVAVTATQGDDEAVEFVSQIAHLALSMGEPDARLSSNQAQLSLPDSTKPVSVASKWSLVSPDRIDLQLPDDASAVSQPNEQHHRAGRMESHRVGRVINAWTLQPVQPSWLDEILSEALDEEESAQVDSLRAYLQDKEQAIRDSFDQVEALKAGLVTLSDSARSCLSPITEAFAAFYSLSGSAFRAKVGNVPSPFVISYTIEQLRQRKDDGGGASSPVSGSVDAALYQLLVEECISNAMVFQRRLEKRWE